MEISSSYVIRFEVVFCIYERQIVFQGIENLRQARVHCKVARKPPKSSSKPVPNGRMHCKVTRRPSRSSPSSKAGPECTPKWPEGRPKAAPKLFQVRPNALQKWYEPSERWVHAGPVQVPCGFILMFASKVLNCVSV